MTDSIVVISDCSTPFVVRGASSWPVNTLPPSVPVSGVLMFFFTRGLDLYGELDGKSRDSCTVLRLAARVHPLGTGFAGVCHVYLGVRHVGIWQLCCFCQSGINRARSSINGEIRRQAENVGRTICRVTAEEGWVCASVQTTTVVGETIARFHVKSMMFIDNTIYVKTLRLQPESRGNILNVIQIIKSPHVQIRLRKKPTLFFTYWWTYRVPMESVAVLGLNFRKSNSTSSIISQQIPRSLYILNKIQHTGIKVTSPTKKIRFIH